MISSGQAERGQFTEPDEPDWAAILDEARAKGFEGDDSEAALEWLRNRAEDSGYHRSNDAA